MPITAFADWQPDQPALGSPGEILINGIPRDTGYYGPARALVEFSGDMNTISATISRTTGAYYWPRTNTAFVGTVDPTAGAKLIAITGVFGTTWQDVSSTNYGAGPMTWRFASYHNKVLAVNGVGGATPQYFDATDNIVTDNFADATGAPKAENIFTARDWIVLVNTNDASDGIVPERIWWSASGDPLDWPTPGTADARQKQSSFTSLSGGGALKAGVPNVGGHDAVIFGETRIWAMNSQPPPTTWRFDPIGDVGVLAPSSVVAWNNAAWWLSERGFMQYDGSAITNVGQGKVNRFFFQDFDLTPTTGTFIEPAASVDSINSTVCWAYRSVNSPNQLPDRQIWYNWRTQKWGHADIACHTPFIAPIDSNRVREGLWFVSPGFSLAKMTGSPLQFEAEPIEGVAEGHQRIWLERARPIIPGALDIQLRMRLRDQQSEAAFSTGYKSIERDGAVPIRLPARYWRARVKVAAAEEWEHALGVEYLTAPFGEKRGGTVRLTGRITSAGDNRVTSTAAERVLR